MLFGVGILLKVLRLLEDLSIDFVSINGRILVFGQEEDEAHFELGLDAVLFIPIGVLGFIIDLYFDLFG